jgi:transglutaminase-like putative cysteine protease
MDAVAKATSRQGNGLNGTPGRQKTPLSAGGLRAQAHRLPARIAPSWRVAPDEPALIRLSFSIALHYEITETPADFVFNVHAAQTDAQSIVSEALAVTPAVHTSLHVDAATATRYLRLRAEPGPLAVQYSATVDIDHHRESPARLEEVPIARIPPQVLPYIYPSRYCPSDRMRRFANREFGHLRPGYWRVQAIHDWVRTRTAFTSGSSDSTTSALDTLVGQAGVCRDFAHLMIAFCRALNIPARFVSGIDYGAPVSMGPPDFHAYVEVFLGTRWYAFDPTGISAPMGLIRIGTGRDAADVSFATLFGSMKTFAPTISITAVHDAAAGYHLPQHSPDALSTSAEPEFADGRY